jgi:hypothetical protein
MTMRPSTVRQRPASAGGDRLLRVDYDDRGIQCFEFRDSGWWGVNDPPPTTVHIRKQIEAHPDFEGWQDDDNAGYDEDCECDSVCTNCEHVPVTEWSCVECDGSIHGEVEKWAFCRGKNQQTCDACLEKPAPVPVPAPAVPVCFNCDEHFTGDQTSDDFLNWEYCEGRKQWACDSDCRYKWDEPCDDDTCVYCGNAERDEEEQYCPCGWALTYDDLALESGKCEGCTLKDAVPAPTPKVNIDMLYEHMKKLKEENPKKYDEMNLLFQKCCDNK